MNKIEKLKIKWEALSYTLLADITEQETTTEIDKQLPDFVKTHCRKLLSIGGSRVCMYYSDINSKEVSLLKGELIDNSKIVKIKGEVNRCHWNCADLWKKNPSEYQIATGYALRGGIWRNHTWLLDGKNQILETTVPAELYYGIILNSEEAEKFCRDLPSK